MDHMEPMDDREIQEKVEAVAGKGTKVVDCEKSTSFESKEILLVNGYPVPLVGDEGIQIKRALLEGQIPSGDLLNQILIRAGILKTPVELETELNVKSTTKTTELLSLRDKHGVLLDERVKEVEEDNEFSTKSTERWKKHRSREAEELKKLGRRVETLKLEDPPPTSSMMMMMGRDTTSNHYQEQQQQVEEEQQQQQQQKQQRPYHVINGEDQDHQRLIPDETAANTSGSGRGSFRPSTFTRTSIANVPPTVPQTLHFGRPRSSPPPPPPSSSSSGTLNSSLQTPLISTQPSSHPDTDAVYPLQSSTNSHSHYYCDNNLQSPQTSSRQNSLDCEEDPDSTSSTSTITTTAVNPSQPTESVRFTYETFV